MVAPDLDRLSKTQLINLIERGILSITMSDKIPNNREDTPEYQQVANLRGTRIHIREAARKYNVPQTTINQWIRRGLITVLGKDKNKTLIDESDIAYCAIIRKQRPGAGRWLFNQDGTPR